ncbi:hypothetical protein [Reinekea blandensis]|nr:hypothetical protein [Reinekea blandensis]
MSDSALLFLGKIEVEYGQFYFDHPDDDESLFDGVVEEAFIDQKNGLCGAGIDGMVYFVAGLNNGAMSVCIEQHEQAPELDSSYDDIVEVSFTNQIASLALCQWAHEATFPLNLPEGQYRLRYCVQGMDNEYGDEDDWSLPMPGQRHLVQLWPASPEADSIIRSNSKMGRYWHKNFGQKDASQEL